MEFVLWMAFLASEVDKMFFEHTVKALAFLFAIDPQSVSLHFAPLLYMKENAVDLRRDTQIKPEVLVLEFSNLQYQIKTGLKKLVTWGKHMGHIYGKVAF